MTVKPPQLIKLLEKDVPKRCLFESFLKSLACYGTDQSDLQALKTHNLYGRYSISPGTLHYDLHNIGPANLGTDGNAQNITSAYFGGVNPDLHKRRKSTEKFRTIGLWGFALSTDTAKSTNNADLAGLSITGLNYWNNGFPFCPNAGGCKNAVKEDTHWIADKIDHVLAGKQNSCEKCEASKQVLDGVKAFLTEHYSPKSNSYFGIPLGINREYFFRSLAENRYSYLIPISPANALDWGESDSYDNFLSTFDDLIPYLESICNTSARLIYILEPPSEQNRDDWLRGEALYRLAMSKLHDTIAQSNGKISASNVIWFVSPTSATRNSFGSELFERNRPKPWSDKLKERYKKFASITYSSFMSSIRPCTPEDINFAVTPTGPTGRCRKGIRYSGAIIPVEQPDASKNLARIIAQFVNSAADSTDSIHEWKKLTLTEYVSPAWDPQLFDQTQ